MRVNTKSFLQSAAMAFAAMFAMALLAYSLFLGGVVSSSVDPSFLRRPVGFSCVTLGYVALAVLMAWVYPHYRLPAGPFWRRGLQFGIVMGLLWIFPLSLVLHGVYRLPWLMVIVDTLWALVEQGAGGVVLAYVYDRADSRRALIEPTPSDGA